MPYHAAWHPQLHRCFILYSFWQKTNYSSKNNKNLSNQLHQLKSQLTLNQVDIYQGDPNRPMRYQLKLAKQTLETERTNSAAKRQQHLTFRQEIMVLEEKNPGPGHRNNIPIRKTSQMLPKISSLNETSPDNWRPRIHHRKQRRWRRTTNTSSLGIRNHIITTQQTSLRASARNPLYNTNGEQMPLDLHPTSFLFYRN
jgi:hypothetical protein